ncbi:MAG: hypothetical protein DHS20C18_48560 [Saprospiraceae bacterium]|nr:MAG: hypothetical protein DHS20C18_48560 [Saprospiraceae bacterium]
MNSGLPSSIYIYSFAIEGSHLFAGASDGVYLSTDNGNSWMAMNSGLTTSFVTWLEVSGTSLYAGTPIGLFVSTNNGSSWDLLKNGATDLVYTNSSTATILVNGTEIFAGGNDGICVSSDGGVTWVDKNNGLPYPDLFSLATNGELVYAGTEKGLYATSDNGNSWDRKFNFRTSSVKARAANIYIGSTSGSIYVSNDSGVNWTLSTGFFDNGEEVVATAGTTVFARYNAHSFNGGIGFISTDNGTSFSMNDFPYSIFANRDETSLFAVDNKVLAYNEETWTPVSSAITNDTVYALAVNSSTFFVATDGGVLTSPYNGTSWTKVPFGLENAKVTSLAVNASTVYACTSNNDIFLSPDNGINWMAITDNFIDTIIAKNPYGTNTTQLLINNTHIFVGAKQGIWTRPLSEIVGLNEQRPDVQFTIYPNPTSGRFSISGNEIETIAVRTILGEIVYTTFGQTEIDLPTFPKGIYFVTVSSEGKRYTKRVMIQ